MVHAFLLTCAKFFALVQPFFSRYSSSVIMQKGDSQNGHFSKTKHVKFSEKPTFASGGKKCSLFGKFDMLCFLETPVLRFALLRYYQRVYVSMVKYVRS